MESDRSQRVALVTGGASGIGRATCELLSTRGYKVVVADLNDADAREVATSLTAASHHVVDVADSAAVDAMVDTILDQFGRLDVAVTAAGIDDPETKALLGEQMSSGGTILRTPTLTDEAWRRQMAVNLDGTFFTVRACVRAMVPAQTGAVVTVASGAAYEATPGYANYVTAKAGVIALTQSIGKEMIGHGIRVNGVAPGLVDTPMLSRAPSGLRSIVGGHPHRPPAAPEEIASVIGFLASEDAINIAAEVVLACGGRSTA